MLTLLNMLFPLMLSLTSTASVAPPAPSPTTIVSVAPIRHCPCDIGNKSW